MRIYGPGRENRKKRKKKKKGKKKKKEVHLPTKSKSSTEIIEVREDGTKVIASVEYDHWKKFNGISPNGFKFKKSSLKRKKDLGI